MQVKVEKRLGGSRKVLRSLIYLEEETNLSIDLLFLKKKKLIFHWFIVLVEICVEKCAGRWTGGWNWDLYYIPHRIHQNPAPIRWKSQAAQV